MVRAQLAAAISRSAALMVTRASFSASSNVAVDTAGPETGPVPNVGGAPAVVGDGGVELLCCRPRHPAAAAIAPIGAVIKNFRRVFMDAGCIPSTAIPAPVGASVA